MAREMTSGSDSTASVRDVDHRPAAGKHIWSNSPAWQRTDQDKHTYWRHAMQGNRKGAIFEVVSVCTLEDEILINRPPREVWDKAIGEPSRWWRDSPGKRTRRIRIEPHVGGRVWEQYDAAGSGLLYGTVVALQPPRMVHFTSTLSIAGVALCAYTWLFSRCGPGTLVNVSVQLLSEYPERLMCNIIKRRISTLLDSLRQYVTASSAAESDAGKVAQPAFATGRRAPVGSESGRTR